MKILFDHASPFSLAHGGFQIQIEQTKRALEEIGVEVEYLCWPDSNQSGDVIHFFGRANPEYIRFAHGKGFKVVMAELLGGLAARSSSARLLQRVLMRVAQRALPGTFLNKLGWESYQLADAIIALTPWESELMQAMFGAPAAKVHVVPNGVEQVFFDAPERPRGKWLVCSATVTERKRVLETAEAAVAAATPLWVIGKGYSSNDRYVDAFRSLVANHPDILRYEGEIPDRAQLAQAYKEARGFVLLSSMESLSLSALEAATCGCPLLLSDLPWARSSFKAAASYCPVADKSTTARCLREFYDHPPAATIKTESWLAVASELRAIYQELLVSSR